MKKNVLFIIYFYYLPLHIPLEHPRLLYILRSGTVFEMVCFEILNKYESEW